MIRALTILCLIAIPATAFAHKPSDAQVRLAVDGDHIIGRVDVAVRDLEAALVIDDGDGAIAWAELVAAEPRIARYLTDRLSIASCTLSFGDGALVDLSDGAYWSAPIDGRCTTDPHDLHLTYALLFDIDAQHRGLIHVGAQTIVVRDAEPVHIRVGADASATQFVREGVWHIWIGLDHILFLLCLLLPAAGARPREVFEIVTAFTLAHSITLVISAIGLFTLPSRVVETAIALSIVAAGVNNLTRSIDARWAVAFALGLLHGFGFSSVLVDLGLPSHELVGALLGFNVGVEIGQAGIVLAVLPILYLLRSTLAYRVLVIGGSSAAALVATFWAYQRCMM